MASGIQLCLFCRYHDGGFRCLKKGMTPYFGPYDVVFCNDYVSKNNPVSRGGGGDGDGCYYNLTMLLAIIFCFFLVVFLLNILFSPGIAITSLFVNYINSSFWAWIWSVVFSVGVFFLIYWLYSKYTKLKKPWIWAICTYVVLSGLSFWLLIASGTDNIVRIHELTI